LQKHQENGPTDYTTSKPTGTAGTWRAGYFHDPQSQVPLESMAFTVKAVTDLAGVIIRLLHHYDEIGLLTPAPVSPSG
jgi:hypothetical protein